MFVLFTILATAFCSFCSLCSVAAFLRFTNFCHNKPLYHWNVTTGDYVCDYFATTINNIRNFHVAVSLNGHLCDTIENFGLILQIYFANVARHIFTRHSHERSLVSFFLHDSCETFLRVSQDIHTNFAYFYFLARWSRVLCKYFYDCCTTLVRQSHYTRISAVQTFGA